MTNRVAELIEALSKPKREVKRIKFPEDIDTDGTQNIIRFMFALPSESEFFNNNQYTEAVVPGTNQRITSNYRQAGSTSLARRLGDRYTRTTTEIDLFMPAQIQTAYGAEWGGSNLGGIGTATDIAGGYSNMSTGKEMWNETWSVVGRNWSDFLKNAAAGTIQGLSPVNAMDARRFFDSFAFNPYLEVVFNGISNRTFSFTFKMIARNRKERDTIQQIIKEFKFHRSPELRYSSQYNYWKFPSEVDIQFFHKGAENKFLFKISTCAITNVTVDYTPDGTYASHEDGAPFSASITVELMELEQLTKERINQGY
jgi:hypothetical protein